MKQKVRKEEPAIKYATQETKAPQFAGYDYLTDDNMYIPEGRTCAHCANVEDCKRAMGGGFRANSRACSWIPRMFALAASVDKREESAA
jgi:hypothetical protein